MSFQFPVSGGYRGLTTRYEILLNTGQQGRLLTPSHKCDGINIEKYSSQLGRKTPTELFLTLIRSSATCQKYLEKLGEKPSPLVKGKGRYKLAVTIFRYLLRVFV